MRLVDGLVGESLEKGGRGARRRARVGQRLVDLAAPVRAIEPPDDDDVDLRFVAVVMRGNLRLLAGMVRANRSWRLIVRLSRALAAAAAAAAFALVTADLWRLADALSWPRLLALTVLSVGATVVWLIFSHRLWERPRGRASREQTVLFNTATTLTLLLGATFLYAALFGLTLLGSLLVIEADVLADALGHDTGIGDYAALAWMASSLGTLAGGLGAASKAMKPCVRPRTATGQSKPASATAESCESEATAAWVASPGTLAPRRPLGAETIRIRAYRAASVARLGGC